MHNIRSLALLSALLVASGVASCTADPAKSIYFDTIKPPKDLFPPRPDGPVNCPNPPTLPAPVLDPYPSQTTQLRQPFRGVAPGATQVVAQGGLGNTAPVSVGSDGRFCIEVELIPDAANSIILTPISKSSCFGQTTKVSVTHKSSPTQDAGGSTAPQNLALAAVVTAGVTGSTDALTPKKGSVASVADGDDKSWAQFEMWDPEVSSTCDKAVWIRFDFGKAYTITRFKLRWGPLAVNDKTYAKCYTLLLSAKASPGDPDPASGDWIVAHQATNADDKVQDVTINPESARWAAVLVHENGGTNVLGYETFDIADIEIWGQDPNVVPPPPPDTCD